MLHHCPCSYSTVVAAPIFLLGEVILSFLNVGFHTSGESWGAMLRSLKDTRVITDFWWNLLPLCMVFLTLLFLNVLNSRLRSREPPSIHANVITAGILTTSSTRAGADFLNCHKR
jgi:ABC-type dipeptide/oligopeptide/nickel transport system permease subunit